MIGIGVVSGDRLELDGRDTSNSTTNLTTLAFVEAAIDFPRLNICFTVLRTLKLENLNGTHLALASRHANITHGCLLTAILTFVDTPA
jgi:hypothetical protein